MRSIILISYIAICSIGQAQDLTLRRSGITDSSSWEAFITTDGLKTVNPHSFYAWFRAGEFHNSQGAYDGYLLHGTFTSRFHDNQLRSRGEFVMGLKDGIWKYWYEDGHLEMLETWQMGQLNGVVETFDREGNLLTSRKYRNGESHGYHYDGWNEGEKRGDEKHGLWIYRDKYGDTIRTETYRKGTLHGPYQELVKRSVVLEGQFSDGQKHGKWIDHRSGDTTYWKKGEPVNDINESNETSENSDGTGEVESGSEKGKKDKKSASGEGKDKPASDEASADKKDNWFKRLFKKSKSAKGKDKPASAEASADKKDKQKKSESKESKEDSSDKDGPKMDSVSTQTPWSLGVEN